MFFIIFFQNKTTERHTKKKHFIITGRYDIFFYIYGIFLEYL